MRIEQDMYWSSLARKWASLLLPFLLAIVLVSCEKSADLTADNHRERCLDGGTFVMGSDAHYPEERAARDETVGPFCIDVYEVTNSDFAEFVAATGYKTLAETGPDRSDYPDAPTEFLQPGSAVFVFAEENAKPSETNWWKYAVDAHWQSPTGGSSDVEALGDLPVVHVAYKDALAYANWRGRDLPTEIEWEYAARGGLSGAEYAWGNERAPGDTELANTWQGSFPTANTADDGFIGLAPVGSFPSNGFGLYDMIGNAWEWTRGDSSRQNNAGEDTQRVIKGGSFLCAPNYCARYRPAARQAQDVGLGTNHVGFRTVRRARM